ncbi:MAG: hypothetical protein DMF87_18135 [Acidobacteria bacterium]|nr:MAG: hypothetical protein DMF88_20240 [Acidobacteriota bacterium]PYR76515.1 MAG: hypothetical protein DMF87_18135 [Acidobacteriota bacterium]
MILRGKKLRLELGTFLRQYARKSVPGWDPNDRTYGRKIERIVRRMDPEKLDRLLRDESDAPTGRSSCPSRSSRFNTSSCAS